MKKSKSKVSMLPKYCKISLSLVNTNTNNIKYEVKEQEEESKDNRTKDNYVAPL